jgi:hypothetical protein
MKSILASMRFRERNCAAAVDIEIRNRSGAKSDSYQIKPVCCSKIDEELIQNHPYEWAAIGFCRSMTEWACWLTINHISKSLAVICM